MNTLKTILSHAGLAVLFAAAQSAMAAEPARLALQLPPVGKAFSPYSMEFSADGARACIAGTDYDEMGTSTGRLLMVDLARGIVLWQKPVAVPDGFATLIPVQCMVAADRVYLLANADTSTSPPQALTFTHVMAFDLHGKQTASVKVNVDGQNIYGYALGPAGDGVNVAGYTREMDDSGERYATYTVTFDAMLRQRGAPVLRKNGAYTGHLGARIVGDSVYLSGRFFEGKATMDDVGRFAASRLRATGGYSWSVPMELKDSRDVHTGVVDNGTTYAIVADAGTTTLSRVAPDGKVLPALAYRSSYCGTQAIALHGAALLAVRKPCTGKGNALVAIDLKAGKEQRVMTVPDEPLYVATHGTTWNVIARDKKGKLYLYSAGGEL